MCQRCSLLGKRVLLTNGMQGQVVSLHINGNIEVANEHEDNLYEYWFSVSEVVRELPPIESPT